MFQPSIVAFVVGWLEMRDDEFVNDGRLQMLFNTFRVAITEAST
jgi:hypothetical protein